MKLILALLTAVTLVGCSTAPVTMKFPSPPDELMKACPDLQKLDPKTTKLSDVLMSVTENYASYHNCKIKVDAWQEWYDANRKIFESVK